MEGWLRQREPVLTISLTDIPLNSYCEFVRVGGDAAEALEPIFGRGVFPCVPYSAEGERLSASQSEGIGLLGLLIQPLPFVKTIGGN
jgi:hypothetical protein